MEMDTAAVTRRTLSGVRWSLILNLVTIPLSFGTNLALGRVSPVALGYYGAIQIFVGGFAALLMPGGQNVFTRLTPQVREEDRWVFLRTYLTLNLTLVGLAWIAALALAPAPVGRLLATFGIPAAWYAVVLTAFVVVWSFSAFFLFGVLGGPQASVTLRTLVIGFFAAAALGFGPLRDALVRDPATYLWRSALGVYGAAALVGIALVRRTREARVRGRLRWLVPNRFWSVVGYTHLGTIITFTYTSLSSSFVLLWLSVEALARLHAAMRYVTLLNVFATLAAPVVAAGIARLEASGQRVRGVAQARTSVRTSMIAIFPICVTVMFFAGDAMALFNPMFRDDAVLLQLVILASLASPMVYLGTGLAVALGAFRGYVVASMVFVASAVALNAILVPRFGLVGAAISLPTAAFIQQLAMAAVLWKAVRFRVPVRVVVAWILGIGACAVAIAARPDRPLAVALSVGFIAAFAAFGRVTPGELATLSRRFLGRGAMDSPAP